MYHGGSPWLQKLSRLGADRFDPGTRKTLPARTRLIGRQKIGPRLARDTGLKSLATRGGALGKQGTGKLMKFGVELTLDDHLGGRAGSHLWAAPF